MTATELKHARAQLGLSQVELGERLEIPANTIARWERGEMSIEKPGLLRLAMEHLRCKPRRKRPHNNA